MVKSFDVIVLGAGAAGLMCAIEAGKRGRHVAVLERADRVGKKILISGGGRCNFTNIHCRPENFLSANPHFAKSALARYTPDDFITLVRRHGIAYHEKTLGQLFCDRSAEDIVEMLEEECRRAKVRIYPGTRIDDVKRDTGYIVHVGEVEYRAPALVVATGGLSIPRMGATGFGYELARQFGLKIRECRPALVPVVFAPTEHKQYGDLSGVATEVVASFPSDKQAPAFREKMLITHRGLSGPAILQISSYWQPGNAITLDLAPANHSPGEEVVAPLLAANARRDLANARSALRAALPNRLADRWIDHNPPSGWTNPALAEFERKLHQWEFTPAGTEGYEKAEVTAGGVDTNELDAKTMQSRKVPGLYFIGEVVDVTGHLGGFNFQWAWASGFSAGQAV